MRCPPTDTHRMQRRQGLMLGFVTVVVVLAIVDWGLIANWDASVWGAWGQWVGGIGSIVAAAVAV